MEPWSAIFAQANDLSVQDGILYSEAFRDLTAERVQALCLREIKRAEPFST